MNLELVTVYKFISKQFLFVEIFLVPSFFFLFFF